MSVRRPDLDGLDQEIRDHLDAETAENIARGMSEADARAAALRKFGNLTRIKEDVRDVWFPRWLDSLRQDLRDAWRQLRRGPAFALAVVVTLTLGIGLTTAIYSVVHAVLLRPLNYAHPERMVWLTTQGKDGRSGIINSIDFARWQPQATSLAHMVAYGSVDSTMVVGGEAWRVRILSASEGLWQVSGAQPLLGTLPAASDTQSLAITHRTFREHFQGDPNIIGRAVSIDGRQVTIAAVLPADFNPQLPTFAPMLEVDATEPAAYRMMRVDPPPQVITRTTGVRIYQAVGELKPGVTVEQARAELEAIHTREQRDHPTGFPDSAAVMMPLRDHIVGPSRLALGVLLAASVVVLLITCANVANLLLSRVAARRKEIALRMAIGSGPLRVGRQLLVESLAYAVLGGVGGIVLGWWLVNAVIAVIGGGVPRLTETTLDWQVLAVTAAVSIGAAMVFGMAPALVLAFTNVQEVLKESGRRASASRRVLFSGRAMVAIQVALTVVLLAGAGLMFKSVWQMTTYPAGFTPDEILTMRVEFRGPQFKEQRARHEFATALLGRAKTLPGVLDVALTTGRGSVMLILREGEELPPPEQRSAKAAPVSSVSGNFGPLLGMSLVSGRWLAEQEPDGAVVINESLARRDFKDRDPIGVRINRPFVGGERFATIVGVARDLKYAALDTDGEPEAFFHYGDSPIFNIMLAMRIDGDPVAAAPAIRKALSQVDPTQSLYDVKTMEMALAESIAPRRFNLLLLGIFAMSALTLAMLGVYGVVAYAVAERTQEIGIRIALGAPRAGVVRMMVTQGMTYVGAGILAGLAAALASSRVIAGLLYGVEPTDAATFALSTLMLTTIAFVACSIPALKAALVDPVVALRAE